MPAGELVFWPCFGLKRAVALDGMPVIPSLTVRVLLRELGCILGGRCPRA